MELRVTARTPVLGAGLAGNLRRSPAARRPGLGGCLARKAARDSALRPRLPVLNRILSLSGPCCSLSSPAEAGSCLPPSSAVNFRGER